jgi:hypothetical protein
MEAALFLDSNLQQGLLAMWCRVPHRNGASRQLSLIAVFVADFGHVKQHPAALGVCDAITIE